jgi:hypothetical protein
MSDKQTAIAEWRAVLENRLQNLESSKDAARSGTRVDGEHRPSNRGERAAVTSSGYLAQGLAQREAAIQTHLDHLESMGCAARTEAVIGAILTLSIDGSKPQRIALFPGGDATVLQCGIQVLSSQSPMAVQLRDAEAGDAVEVDLGARIVDVEIESIA